MLGYLAYVKLKYAKITRIKLQEVIVKVGWQNVRLEQEINVNKKVVVRSLVQSKTVVQQMLMVYLVFGMGVLVKIKNVNMLQTLIVILFVNLGYLVV